MVNHGIIANSGIDYCTATGRSTSAQVFLYETGNDLIAQERHKGERIRPWRGLGYTGLVCGAVGLGAGDNGTILRLSGRVAATHGREVCAHADRVSRIDLQSTVRFSRDVSSLDRHHAREIRRAIAAGQRKRNTTAIITNGKGNTLLVGSRQSNYYGRVYDKYRESGDDAYRRCWRYEVEVKGDASAPLARRIAQSESVDQEAAALVHSWFTRVGCNVRYRPGLAAPLAPIGAVDSDAQRFMAWLKNQVCPGLRRLQEWYAREDLIALLFDGLELEAIRQIYPREGEGLQLEHDRADARGS